MQQNPQCPNCNSYSSVGHSVVRMLFVAGLLCCLLITIPVGILLVLSIPFQVGKRTCKECGFRWKVKKNHKSFHLTM